MKKICLQCGKEFMGRSWNAKYCSYECRQTFKGERYKETNPIRGNTSATTGAISELRVAVDLMAKGYNVFRSLSPSCPCDLAVLRNGNLLRIEVRTVHISLSGKLYKSKCKRDDPNNIDHYAWVSLDAIRYEPEL